jgi:hypothetical protein
VNARAAQKQPRLFAGAQKKAAASLYGAFAFWSVRDHWWWTLNHSTQPAAAAAPGALAFSERCKNRRAHSHTSSIRIWFDEFPIKPFHTRRRNWRCGEASGAAIMFGQAARTEQTFALSVCGLPKELIAPKRLSLFQQSTLSLKPFIRVLRANQLALEGWMNSRLWRLDARQNRTAEKLCAFENSPGVYIQEWK